MAEPSASPQSVIDAVVNVESRVADFIANGPDDGLAGYVRDRYRDRCDEYANAPAWARALANAPSGSLNRICSPWFAARGFDGPAQTARGSGGQCEGVLYNVVRTATNTSTGAQVVTPYNGRVGPITLTRGPEPPGGCPAFFNGWFLRDGNGNTIWASGDCSTNFASNPSYTATRADGLPDTCGNQDPFFEPGDNPPPNPGPQPGPEPTQDPNNPTGPPLLPIPPYDDPVGGPTPVVGPEQNPDTVGPGDIPGNPDSAPGDPDAIAPPVEVNPGPGGGGNETNFGTPPEGRAWVGCFVIFDIPEELGSISGSEPGNRVLPRVFANGSLVYASGRGIPEQIRGEHWSQWRPTGALQVTGVYVNVNPGITYTVRPVSIELCPPNPCAEE